MKFSLPPATSRLQRARRNREDPDEDEDDELNCMLQQTSQIWIVEKLDMNDLFLDVRFLQMELC